MKIAVLVKSVPDTASTPQINAGGRSVATEQLEYVLNPFDEYAVEQAVQLKESLGAAVTAVSLGGENARKALRSAFAMGIDNGVLVLAPATVELTGRGVAICLTPVLRDLAPDLILAGKQAVDDDGAQVAERVAEHLGFAHVSAVNRLAMDGNRVSVNRALEGGHLALDIPLPALVTADKGLNTPRYPALPQILKARRIEIQEVEAPDLGSDLEPGWLVETLTMPRPQRRRQVFAEDVSNSVKQLVDLLQQELGP